MLASKMAQWIKTFDSASLWDLNSIPEIHVKVKGKSELKVVL